MKTIWKIFKWLGIFIVVCFGILIASLYIFKVDYIIKGVYVTYLHGHTTAYIDDYHFFDNHLITHGAGEPWKKSIEYNKFPISDSLKRVHDRTQSVAYLIIHQDSLWFEEYYAGYTDSSKSNSFSMAKSMVAALLGKAIELGKVKSLDQKVKDFVPEVQGPYADSLTFKDLVSMSSGMKWEEKYYDPFSITTRLYFDRDIVGALDALPIIQQPGQSFKYQSGDTQLLGIALQRATGQSLSDLLSTYFWKPMGAEQDALWQVDSKQNGIEKAYCCVASNAKDFARFGKLYFQHGRWNGQQVLDSAYISQSIQNRFPDSPEYGYGWWMGTYQDKPYFYMDGHLGQYVIVIPQDDLIIVRLGKQIDGINKADPRSAFYNFIDQSYRMLGNRIKSNPNSIIE